MRWPRCITETVIGKNFNGAINEPWQLVGIDGHPPSLDDLLAALEDICAIADELANDSADTVTITQRALLGSSTRALRRAADVCRAAKKYRQQVRREEIQDACRTTGLRARVFDFAQTSSTTGEYRVCVELDSLFDWYGAVDSLQAALHADPQASETYLLVPLRHGRPIPGLVMKLINNLWPVPNPDGLEKLPQAHPSELADTFNQTQRLLQKLSGICCLPDEQRTHDKVEEVAEALVSQLATACEKLRELPDDPVTDLLHSIVEGLAVRVQAENDGTSTEPNLAAQTTPLDHDEITDELQMITHANLIALEWDINPQATTELFLSTTD